MTDLFEHQAQQQAAAPPTRRRSAATKRAAAKRRRRRQQRTAVVLVVVLGVVGAGGYLLWDRLDDMVGDLPFIGSQAEDYPGPGDAPVEVEIPEGATGAQMGAALVEADVVASTAAFNEAFGANPAAAGIQPGTYQLLTQMKASDAVAALVKNEKIQTDVTIPEGYSVDQIVERVGSVTTIPAEDLQAALKKPNSFGLPKQAGGNAEGWLFPKTYTVQPGDDATSLLTKMVEQTKTELSDLGVPKDAWHDTLTKASIVEKEAPDGYQGEVARVIQNRLDRGSPLGMDAIDAYGRGKPADQITVDEFNDSEFPYASREQIGLPPTPISNPGTASVEAVISPPQGEWMWYVTVNLDTGETKFTDSYSEFEQFKSEYQAWAAENS
ncbi:endolytic transglycosylase MltG [Isoptericola cucumis]|uniref:Endolytic murein transglycosylase n=1 Tax=Isoptericola cucumis TaxID=1776856 RepID=A0ABQ2B6L0_9MICO|nr:endolytic transglycosylase MltG [Isoptericola cucumis]GGI07424.1 ABC transporter substrate-binding protein [Isoptericola cucumis]